MERNKVKTSTKRLCGGSNCIELCCCNRKCNIVNISLLLISSLSTVSVSAGPCLARFSSVWFSLAWQPTHFKVMGALVDIREHSGINLREPCSSFWGACWITMGGVVMHSFALTNSQTDFLSAVRTSNHKQGFRRGNGQCASRRRQQLFDRLGRTHD